jgi:hypothetical protein
MHDARRPDRRQPGQPRNRPDRALRRAHARHELTGAKLQGNRGARRWAVAAGVAFAGIALGLGSAWLALRNPWSAPTQAAGAWRTSLVAGSTDADPHTRARVALGGLLALSRDETLYYVAGHDDSGAPLRTRCSYRVEGQPPPARWWSVTAYADDFFLFDHPARRYSLNGGTARLDARGRFALVTGPTPADAATHWLPTPAERGLVLVLRLYNPDPALVATPQALAAPSIVRVGDCAP